MWVIKEAMLAAVLLLCPGFQELKAPTIRFENHEATAVGVPAPNVKIEHKNAAMAVNDAAVKGLTSLPLTGVTALILKTGPLK